MNEVLLDQIPSLIDLQRYLEQLSIMEPPAIKKDIILEQVNSFGQQFLLKSIKMFFLFFVFVVVVVVFNTVELLTACLLKICLWYCYHSNHLPPSFSLLFFPFLLQENRMERDRPGIEVTIVHKRPEFFFVFVFFIKQ